jgi:hypothetical protein
MNFFDIPKQQGTANLMFAASTTASSNQNTTNNSNLLFDNLMKPSVSNNHPFHHAKSSSDVFPNIGSTLSNDIWQ